MSKVVQAKGAHHWMLFIGLALAVSIGSIAPGAVAQEVQPYEYARPGQPTMTLYVWGAVSRPGIWVVEREASLVEVLSLVNIQAEGGLQEGVRENRFLRIYRGSGADGTSGGPYSERSLVFETPLDDVRVSSQPPSGLRDGDILSVEVERRRTWFTLRNVTSVLGAAASITLLIIRLGEL